MMKWLITVVLVFLSAPAWAQNSCTVTQPGLAVVTNPNASVYGTMTKYNETFNGQPTWTESEIGVFLRGANPATATPVRTLTVLKASWTLVLATNDCYRAAGAGAFLYDVPPNVEHDLYIRLKNPAATDPAVRVGAWSTPAIPFGRPGPPDALTAVRVIP